MSERNAIGPGIVKKGEAFQVRSTTLAIAETTSGYTLYSSISCEDPEAGTKAWKEAAGLVPTGWQAYSDPIPAGTQHFVEVAPGTVFFLYGLTDDEAYIRR